ncbi:uncharacterized protein LOC116171908, partial [Photinus pyralis]|uniref:uncharacterized protein LOC116171908 n=1 Tax=Photinus pyralis TaxID=7054 RepID=UPI001266EFAC
MTVNKSTTSVTKTKKKSASTSASTSSTSCTKVTKKVVDSSKTTATGTSRSSSASSLQIADVSHLPGSSAFNQTYSVTETFPQGGGESVTTYGAAGDTSVEYRHFINKESSSLQSASNIVQVSSTLNQSNTNLSTFSDDSNATYIVTEPKEELRYTQNKNDSAWNGKFVLEQPITKKGTIVEQSSSSYSQQKSSSIQKSSSSSYVVEIVDGKERIIDRKHHESGSSTAASSEEQTSSKSGTNIIPELHHVQKQAQSSTVYDSSVPELSQPQTSGSKTIKELHRVGDSQTSNVYKVEDNKAVAHPKLRTDTNWDGTFTVEKVARDNKTSQTKSDSRNFFGHDSTAVKTKQSDVHSYTDTKNFHDLGSDVITTTTTTTYYDSAGNVVNVVTDVENKNPPPSSRTTSENVERRTQISDSRDFYGHGIDSQTTVVENVYDTSATQNTIGTKGKVLRDHTIDSKDVVYSNDRNYGKTSWNGQFTYETSPKPKQPTRSTTDSRDFYGHGVDSQTTVVDNVYDTTATQNTIGTKGRVIKDHTIDSTDVVYSNERNYGKTSWNGQFTYETPKHKPGDQPTRPQGSTTQSFIDEQKTAPGQTTKSITVVEDVSDTKTTVIKDSKMFVDQSYITGKPGDDSPRTRPDQQVPTDRKTTTSKDIMDQTYVIDSTMNDTNTTHFKDSQTFVDKQSTFETYTTTDGRRDQPRDRHPSGPDDRRGPRHPDNERHPQDARGPRYPEDKRPVTDSKTTINTYESVSNFSDTKTTLVKDSQTFIDKQSTFETHTTTDGYGPGRPQGIADKPKGPGDRGGPKYPKPEDKTSPGARKPKYPGEPGETDSTTYERSVTDFSDTKTTLIKDSQTFVDKRTTFDTYSTTDQFDGSRRPQEITDGLGPSPKDETGPRRPGDSREPKYPHDDRGPKYVDEATPRRPQDKRPITDSKTTYESVSDFSDSKTTVIKDSQTFVDKRTTFDTYSTTDQFDNTRDRPRRPQEIADESPKDETGPRRPGDVRKPKYPQDGRGPKYLDETTPRYPDDKRPITDSKTTFSDTKTTVIKDSQTFVDKRTTHDTYSATDGPTDKLIPSTDDRSGPRRPEDVREPKYPHDGRGPKYPDETAPKYPVDGRSPYDKRPITDSKTTIDTYESVSDFSDTKTTIIKDSQTFVDKQTTFDTYTTTDTYDSTKDKPRGPQRLEDAPRGPEDTRSPRYPKDGRAPTGPEDDVTVVNKKFVDDVRHTFIKEDIVDIKDINEVTNITNVNKLVDNKVIINEVIRKIPAKEEKPKLPKKEQCICELCNCGRHHCPHNPDEYNDHLHPEGPFYGKPVEPAITKGERAPIVIPKDNLKPEGEFERPKHDEWRPGERVPVKKPEDNLRPEGDFEKRKPEEWKPGDRAPVRRPEDNLRPEGDFEKRTPEKWQPAERPQPKKPQDNLRPEGDFEKRKPDEWKPGDRAPVRRPEDNLRPEGDFEQRTPEKWQPGERAKPKKPQDNLRPEGDFEKRKPEEWKPGDRAPVRRPEDNLRPEGDFEKRTPEKWQPGERPQPKKPQDNLRPEGEFEKRTPEDWKPGDRSPIKKPTDNLRPEGDFVGREPEKWSPAERPVQKKPKDNLKPEGEFDRPEKPGFKPAERPVVKRPTDNLYPEGDFVSTTTKSEDYRVVRGERADITRHVDNITVTGEFIGEVGPRPSPIRRNTWTKIEGDFTTDTTSHTDFVDFSTVEKTTIVKKREDNLIVEG